MTLEPFSQPSVIQDRWASSSLYGAGEDVFKSRPDRIAAAPVRRFDDLFWDANGVLPRRNNVTRSQMRVRFPEHPAWSLRSREVAMTLLNTSDPRLLARSVSFGHRIFTLGHVRSRCECYRTIAAWQLDQGLPDDISSWEQRDWTQIVSTQIAKGSLKGTIRNLVSAVRELVVLAPILTGGGLSIDPWSGKSATRITKDAATEDTQVIPPQRWIPLIGACWTYIDAFADDILSLRGTHECQMRPGMLEWEFRKTLTNDDYLEHYLRSGDAVIPMRVIDGQAVPNWTQLAQLMTGGRGAGSMLKGDAPMLRRRQRVLDEIASGAARCEVLTQDAFDELLVRRMASKSIHDADGVRLRAMDSDAVLGAWLALPDSCVAVTSPHWRAPDEITAADVNWALMERIVYGSGTSRGVLAGNGAAVARRQEKVVALARSGQTFRAPRGIGLMGMPRPCDGFTHVETADGLHQPWRASLSDYGARCELRALRAACFVFIAAMTMMRDSEIQDLRRGCISTVHGVSAVTSNQYKGRRGKTVAHWWIVDQVASTIHVLERLSVHPEFLFAGFVEGALEETEPGMRSSREIAFLLHHLDEWGERSGLDPIPKGPVICARALRRTTACISRELGGNELALSQQLKHTISYGYSNVTAAYMAPDPEWASLLDTNRSEEDIAHMVEIIQQSSRDEHPLAGRGGERLAQEIAKAVTPKAAGEVKAIMLSDAELSALLKKVAPVIRFGTANACIYDEETALCRKQATTEIQGPLFGLCQPQRCPNSVVAARHLPMWIAELDSLKASLSKHRVSPPRRMALSQRLRDVEQVVADAQRRVAGDNR